MSENHEQNLNNSTNSLNKNLIACGETLVKVEEKAVVVRNLKNVLVRRAVDDFEKYKILKLMKPTETLLEDLGDSIIVKLSNGKKVKRKISKKTKQDSLNESENLNIDKRSNEDDVVKTPEPEKKSDESFDERILAKHQFLSRMERGESLKEDKVEKTEDLSVDNTEDIEEIESLTEDKEDESDYDEINPDSDVSSLNSLTQKRDIKNASSGALKPKSSSGLVGEKNTQKLLGNTLGDSSVSQSKLLKKREEQKSKKEKKPFKTWIIPLTLGVAYLLILMVYFFTQYNFNVKKVDVVTYYISTNNIAKTEYYDGEKFNFNGMMMTYYYSDENIVQSQINESNLGESTDGMGYKISNGFISALWKDGYENKGERQVKIKFVCDKLVCYVPITIYRNSVSELIKNFEISSLSAGQKIEPTILARYSNAVLGTTVNTRVLYDDELDLILTYSGQDYSLKNDCDAYKNGVYTMPTEIDGASINYSGTIKLTAKYLGDGYNSPLELELLSN